MAKKQDRRKTFTTRITAKTRALLEQAAAESGRSLSQEIELRLEKSFWREHYERGNVSGY